MSDFSADKSLLGSHVAAKVVDGQYLGVGTGTTVDHVIDALAIRVKAEALRLFVVPTSYATAHRCQAAGLTVCSPFAYPTPLEWAFDGADEVDEDLRLIKGRGGALLQEKIIASLSRRFVVLVDRSKMVHQLGSKSPVPIEVIPTSLPYVRSQLTKLGATAIILRDGKGGKHGPAISENGNLLLDVTFPSLPTEIDSQLKSITGVVEHGIFTGLATEVLLAENGKVRTISTTKEGFPTG